MPDKPTMPEMKKYRAGQPYDLAKLYQEMDDDSIDSIMQGLRNGHAKPTQMSQGADGAPADDNKK